MQKVKIYTLTHPITKDVFYVGKTVRALKARLACHISTKENSTKDKFIKTLLSVNLKPEIELIEEVEEPEWQRWEKYWIYQFRAWGFTLLNESEGGLGSKNRVLTEETKNKIKTKAVGRKSKLKGIKRENFTVWNKGKVGVYSEEVILKMKKDRKGKFKGENHPRVKLNEEKVLQIRSLLKTQTTKELAELFEISESTISAIKHRRIWKHI